MTGRQAVPSAVGPMAGTSGLVSRFERVSGGSPATARAVPTRGRVWYHGGVPGRQRGDLLTPSPPHVTDGCPVCIARSEGTVLTVGQYRAWLEGFGPRARPVLEALEGAPDDAPLDPPSEREGIYVTTHEGYAAWYAARSGHGDLYEVAPIGEIVLSDTDHFPTAVVAEARVVRVMRQAVRLTRRERRALLREWQKRDAQAEVVA